MSVNVNVLARTVAEQGAMIAEIQSGIALLLAAQGLTAPAIQAPVTPPRNSKADHRAVNPNVAEAQPKADVRYRTAKAKAAGREQASAIWARHYAAAGVKRFKDLTPAQQKAAKAEVAGAWKGVKGTRKTAA